MNLARIGNKYLADTEPWKLAKTDLSQVGSILNLSLQIAANLAIAFEPFLPFTADKLRKMLAMDDFSWESLGRTDLLQIGQLLNPAELLFEKIEDEAIEQQIQKLLDTKNNNKMTQENRQEASWTPAPAKAPIDYDSFSKMDIRVGTILQAEAVPNTDKLMKLLVDTGLDQRTIVSGVLEHFSPEELIGKQVSVLINLEPRKIRGIVSQGMVLYAENDQKQFALVQPQADKTTPNGSLIC